ncbi:MAG: helix-turn-helix transcriptional regulator [Paludibacteraceae bacterium]
MNIKRKKQITPSLLYLDEHRACSNYISDFFSGFSYKQYGCDFELKLALKKQFAVIFMQNGVLEVISDLNEIRSVHTNEIALLNYEKNYTCKMLEDSVFTLLYFDYPKIKCDKYSLLSLGTYNKQKLEEDIRILPMKNPLKAFVDNMNIYLKNNMICRHLHDLKESEWLFLMRGFYTKEESAYFLEPVISSLNDFVTVVKENYLLCESIKDLAEKCNMSEKTFTRRFKEHFNDTPKQWVMREKAKYIKSELDHSNLNIKEIANKFGFSSPAHLNNYFKKQFNTTPGKSKKNI